MASYICPILRFYLLTNTDYMYICKTRLEVTSCYMKMISLCEINILKRFQAAFNKERC